MTNMEQMGALLIERWGKKSLESLRQQAKSEATGIAFDAIRIAGGKRLMVVICVTKKDQIRTLERVFDFADGGSMEDWSHLTLLQIAMRAAAGRGFAFESLSDFAGEMSDLILIAADPRSITILERAFEMPK